MKRLYEKYKNKMIRFKDGVTGVIVGFSSEHLILSVDDINIPYCFTMDDLKEEKEFYLDPDFLESCDLCLLTWINESDVINYLNGKKATKNTETLS